MKNLFKNKIFLTFIISFFVFLVIFLFENIFYTINDDLKSFSIKSKSVLNSVNQSEDFISDKLVFIKIDERTLESLGFPMPRSNYVPVIENLKKASVIGFDIIFANENKLDKSGDEKFAEAIKKSGNIVLGGSVSNEKGELEKALKIFDEGISDFGYYNPNVDSRSNRVTSFFPKYKLRDSNGETKIYNHFTISLLKTYLNKNKNSFFEKSDENFYYLNDEYKIPFSGNGKKDVLVNFIPIPAKSENKFSKFVSYSFLDVYKGKIAPEVFEGKIVVIGVTSQGIKDIFTTPNGIEFGVFVHGNILNTILTKNYLQIFPKFYEFLFIFLLIFVSVYFNITRNSYNLIFSNIGISIIFLLIFPTIILFNTSYLLSHLSELFIALPLSLGSANIFKYLTENKNRRKLAKALGEYVSRDVANEILTNSGELNLNGEKKELSILFSDIEGFTSISEKFSPENLVGFLRDYLGSMSNIILDKQGFINKYEGDAIMALWGNFKEFENSPKLACESSINQQKLLKELNKKWQKEGFLEIKARIGLHFGEAIVGNIGATGRKLEYTALGDNVNLASRLEGVNKFYGTYICASETIYKKTKKDFIFRYLDEIKVKGKNNAIKIYELVDYKENLTQKLKLLISDFEEAIGFYKIKNFQKAKNIFLKLAERGDAPSKTYLERCEYYLKNNPPKNWDGVWAFTSKG